MDIIYLSFQYLFMWLFAFISILLILTLLGLAFHVIHEHFDKNRKVVNLLNSFNEAKIKPHIESLNLQEKEDFFKICQNNWCELIAEPRTLQTLLNYGLDINQAFTDYEQEETIFTVSIKNCKGSWGDKVISPSDWLNVILDNYKHDLPQLRLFQEQAEKMSTTSDFILDLEDFGFSGDVLFEKLNEYRVAAEQDVLDKQIVLLAVPVKKKKLNKI